MAEQIIQAERMEQIINVFGSLDENIRIIEQEFDVKIINRDTELKVSGDDEAAQLAAKVLEGLIQLAAKGESIGEQNVRYVIGLVREGQEQKITELTKDVICITAKGKPIKAKTLGQQQYMKAIEQNTITLGVGPAGTGKTYLAVAAAVAAFRAREVNRIILTRPCGRGRRAAGLFAGGYAEQGRSLSPAPV